MGVWGCGAAGSGVTAPTPPHLGLEETVNCLLIPSGSSPHLLSFWVCWQEEVGHLHLVSSLLLPMPA